MLRRTAGAVLCAMLVALAPAFCKAADLPTSEPAPVFKPAPGDPRIEAPAPVAPTPPPAPPAPKPPPAPVAVPTPGGPDIALVLPLNAPAYARAAEAVRTGFLAAAEAAGQSARCVVVPHSEDGVIAAFDAARDRGAHVIVGPLVRDDLKTLAIAGGNWPTTLALNQLDDGTPLPPNTYTLALSVESDARALAQRALHDGARAMAVVEGDAAIMHRLAVAFTSDWVAGGAAPPTAIVLDASPGSLADLRKAFGRNPPDAVLLALDGERTALVKPYIGSVPAYASGLLFERTGALTSHDIDGLRVADIPWLLTPDAPELAALPRREFANAALTRLYALGLDAFRVAQALAQGPPERLELDGAIGHLVLGADRQFERTPLIGVYRDGTLSVPEPTR